MCVASSPEVKLLLSALVTSFAGGNFIRNGDDFIVHALHHMGNDGSELQVALFKMTGKKSVRSLLSGEFLSKAEANRIAVQQHLKLMLRFFFSQAAAKDGKLKELLGV